MARGIALLRRRVDELLDGTCVLEERLGFAASQIQTPSLGADDRKALLDGNGYTTVTLEAGQTSLELLFEDARPIQKLIYTPSQQRDASGHVRSYSSALRSSAPSDGVWICEAAKPRRLVVSGRSLLVDVETRARIVAWSSLRVKGPL